MAAGRVLDGRGLWMPVCAGNDGAVKLDWGVIGLRVPAAWVT